MIRWSLTLQLLAGCLGHVLVRNGARPSAFGRGWWLASLLRYQSLWPFLWSTSSPTWDAPDLQLLAGVDDWHLSYVISCPFYDVLLLPRGMRPTFSFWQGLMNSSPTWDVPDLQLLAGVDDWHLSYDISCPFYVLLLLPRGMCPTFSFWLGARTLGFCNGMC